MHTVGLEYEEHAAKEVVKAGTFTMFESHLETFMSRKVLAGYGPNVGHPS